MSKYLEKVASASILNYAWHTISDNRSAWCGDLSVKDMQPNLIRHIGELSEHLLSGKFSPEPMCCQEVNSRRDGKRFFCQSAVRDQLVQSAILIVLESLNEAAFFKDSQHPSEIYLAKVRHLVSQGHYWLGMGKIKDCLVSIPYEQVLKSLYKLCGDKALVSVVRQFVECLPDDCRPAGKVRGLPDGLLLSPFLRELHLHHLDMLLHNKGIPLVRVADEFVVFADSQDAAIKALGRADKFLVNLGLSLVPDHSHVVKSSFRYKFLGKRLPNSQPLFRSVVAGLRDDFFPPFSRQTTKPAFLGFWHTEPAQATFWQRVSIWKRG